MYEVREEEEHKVQCFLVAGPARKDETGEPYELKGLVDTLGMETCGVLVLNRIEQNPVYGMGSGKAQEIANKAKECFAECIIFDFNLESRKQRNWEKLTNIPCFDRNEVILRIFADRAQTKEAVLQVELAKLVYSLPRLSHMYGNMARQRGGNYGAKGSGETQLELDRRQVEDKIIAIKKELEQVEQTRDTQRKQREKTAAATCALVGYTNAGKSSLLNALTGADVFVENKLFATLDPTTRRLELPEGNSILLTDTVGFISNLPHTLINAFKSTLEEAALAQLLLIVVDASDEHCKQQYDQVIKVLTEINADNVPRQIVLNKCDLLNNDQVKLAELDALFPGAVHVSAKQQIGFEELLSIVTERLLGVVRVYHLPLSRPDIVAMIRKNGTVITEEWKDEFVEVSARVPGEYDKDGKPTSRTLALLDEFLIKE